MPGQIFTPSLQFNTPICQLFLQNIPWNHLHIFRTIISLSRLQHQVLTGFKCFTHAPPSALHFLQKQQNTLIKLGMVAHACKSQLLWGLRQENAWVQEFKANLGNTARLSQPHKVNIRQNTLIKMQTPVPSLALKLPTCFPLHLE
jgi:hypothetical protein